MTLFSRLFCLFAALALFKHAANDAGGAAGATTPFRTLEAEGGTLGGSATVRSFTPGDPVPINSTPELESSGRAFVELTSPGDSVSLVNPGPSASTIVIRAAIPDAPTGGGTTATLNLYVDGVFRQAITLSSAQTWVYGTNNGMSNDPAAGPPHVFFDETRAWIAGAAVAPESTITLQGIRLGPTYLNTTIANNLIDHPATKGTWIKSGVTGTGWFECNTVINLNAGEVEFQNDSPATFTATVVGCPPSHQHRAAIDGDARRSFATVETAAAIAVSAPFSRRHSSRPYRR
jgi:hypothetical protein